MADQQAQNGTAMADVAAAASSDVEHDDELDALLSSKNCTYFVLFMVFIVQIAVFVGSDVVHSSR
jgi:hypothetical protein